ncbi:porin [Photobacterium sagamiensis]|uniref:oligogalacturonate-specific porin KdgM family protein n=1 Tax=Photobacterium sagamiensis TaxID=2910241 RepID=UPI003D0D2CE3
MKRVVLGSVALLMAQSAVASSYVTGNVQFHDSDLHGSNVTSTLEAGHTFGSGTTLLVEFDGIQIGELKAEQNSPAYVTMGVEQSLNISDNLWVAAGYHHLSANGETVQHRPLVKIGYNFDNGLSISNRTRFHLDAVDDNNDTRMDNAIGYQVQSLPLNLKYNNVYMIDGEVMDHELRATWTRSGVQPYFELRNQADNENNAFVFGASYGF